MIIKPAGSAVGIEDAREREAIPLLLTYWHIFKRRKWLILAIVAAAMIAGLVLTLLTTPQYTAKTRLAIEREQKNVTNVVGLEDESVGSSLEYYQTQYALLEARSLAERVARALKLDQNRAFFEAYNVDVNVQEGMAEQGSSRRRLRQAVRILQNHVQIVPVRGSSLVDVQYTSPSPALSAEIANEWANQFIVESIDRRFEATADAREYLETRLDELRTRLEESERAVVNYAENRGIVTVGSGEDGATSAETRQTITSNDLAALNAALAEATANRIAAQSRLAGSASAETLSNQTIAALRQRRAVAEAQYEQLMVQFEPGYPAAQALQREIASFESAIAAEEARVNDAVRSGYREALARENGLRSQVEQLKNLVIAERDAGIQYNIYEREADTNRQLYDALLQRYKEIGVAGVGVSNVSVVDRAQPPNNPSSPNLFANLIISLLAGSVLAGLTVLGLQQIDEGLQDANDVKSKLGLPLLGAVPDQEGERSDIVAEISDPKSHLSEAYLTTISNLAFATDHGAPRSFLVTSTREAEGKSTTSLALATILARTGSRVLLIDGDMRSPSVQDLLGTTNSSGMSNYLAGHDEWRDLVRTSPLPNLSVMMAGPTPPNAADPSRS